MCSHDHHKVASTSFDATLQSCCEREQAQQRKIEQYKETLLQDDPTQTRQKIRRDAVVRDVDRLQSSSLDDSDSIEDDNDDQLLELRRQRIQELKQSLSQKVNTVIEVEESMLMSTLEEDISSETICCLIQPSFSRRNDLVEYLMAIAETHGAYRFVTCHLQQHSRMPSLLGQSGGSHDTVILLLCKHVVVASITVLDDDAWRKEQIEKSIISCIGSHTCVSTTIQGRDNSSEEDDEEEPCSTCGRRYPHQHV